MVIRTPFTCVEVKKTTFENLALKKIFGPTYDSLGVALHFTNWIPSIKEMLHAKMVTLCSFQEEVENIKLLTNDTRCRIDDAQRRMKTNGNRSPKWHKTLIRKKPALVFHQKAVNTHRLINLTGFIINESFSYVLHFVSIQPLKISNFIL